jgi:voltage-gated sodium channel
MTETIQDFVRSKGFQWSVLALIVVAAVLVGLETSPEIMGRYGRIINQLNDIVLWAFVAEAALKMAQHGRHFYRYFKDPWNVFDFTIVVICFLPINAQYVAVLRLARVFRALRLITALPKLQMIVGALLVSLPSMFYVGLLLFLLFYLYGVMAVFLFRANDPVHFINLPTAMLTLFRVVTQEDWTDVMYIQMYGSDVYTYANTTGIEPVPTARPVLGALFFVSFVFFGTMIMLNLFIGVILNSMEEVQRRKEAEMLGATSDELPPEGTTLAAISLQLEDLGKMVETLDGRLEAIRQQFDRRS